MALGGFKFAGYKISKDADGAWDAAWALKAHRARIKAFRSACELSSSWGSDSWHYDTNWMSGDATDAESTPSSVIYYIDASDFAGYGYNMITFYRWGSEDKYFAIVTCGYLTSGYFNNDAACRCYRGSASAAFGATFQQLFHVMSYDPFESVDFIKDGKTYPTRALSLYPIAGFYFASTSPGNLNPSANASNGLLYKSGLRFGYSVRGKFIASIVSTSSWFSASYDKFDVTLLAFDSMTLSSPNDTANIFEVCPQKIGSNVTNANGATSSSSNTWPNGSSDTLKDNFDRYITTESSKQGSDLYTIPLMKAFFGGSPQSIPFESVTLTAGTSRTSSPYLNNDGISSKGTIDIECLSANHCYQYSTSKPVWTTFANGNYLCVYACSTANTYAQANYYIGWDPSNPDITADASWTAYDGT